MLAYFAYFEAKRYEMAGKKNIFYLNVKRKDGHCVS
jgi:hypothetical protein